MHAYLFKHVSFFCFYYYYFFFFQFLFFVLSYFIFFSILHTGCYTSHINILREIQNEYKNKQNYNVLILEDNLEMTKRISEKVLLEVAQFIKTENNWDVFHLAYMM